jgi:hypothetical protein
VTLSGLLATCQSPAASELPFISAWTHDYLDTKYHKPLSFVGKMSTMSHENLAGGSSPYKQGELLLGNPSST